MRIKSAWDMGQRGTELVERLSTFITTNIMLDQCPRWVPNLFNCPLFRMPLHVLDNHRRCLSRFDLHIGCMAVKCEDVGNKVIV